MSDNSGGFYKDVTMNNTTTSNFGQYAKISHRTFNKFHSKKITPMARLIYMTFSCGLSIDTNIAKMTYADISEASGIVSHQTIKRTLTELIEAELVECVAQSTYRLRFGIFKGIIENNNDSLAGCPLHKIDLNPVRAPHPPSKPPQNDGNSTVIKEFKSSPYGVYIYNNNKSRHENRLDDFYKLKFKNGSAFREIPKPHFDRLLARYGIELVQDRLSRLDRCYESGSVRKSAIGLIWAAVKNGGDWAFESKFDMEAKEMKENMAVTRKNMEKGHQESEVYRADQREFAKEADSGERRFQDFKKTSPTRYQRLKQETIADCPIVKDRPAMLEMLIKTRFFETTYLETTPSKLVYTP